MLSEHGLSLSTLKIGIRSQMIFVDLVLLGNHEGVIGCPS